MKTLSLTLLILIFSATGFGQNVLEEDVNNWPPGQENPIAGFFATPSTDQNIRVFEPGPFNEPVLTWKATPDDDGDQHGGGLASIYHNIDFTKKYRFTVWLKKTGTNEGLSYLGAWEPSHVLEIFYGNVDENPLFLAAALPELDTWYLAVGFIQNNEYSSTDSEGRLYDQQGNEVGILRDYKWATWSSRVRLRAFSYFDTNPNNALFLYAPRMEEVNDIMPDVNELLQIENTGRLNFLYDSAGNQTIRKSPDSNGSSGKGLGQKLPELYTENAIPPAVGSSSFNAAIVQDDLDRLQNDIAISPNPTSGLLLINWNQQYKDLVAEIRLSDFSGKSVPIKFKQGQTVAEADLTRYPSGIYLVSVVLKDGRSIEKKIIRK